MYKDAIHEGFHRARYFRSVIVGGVVAVILQPRVDLDVTTAGGLVVFFGLVYVCERVIVEIWKTFFRDEDQGKYTIPMQFRLLNKPVRSRLLRASIGVLCLAVVGLAAMGIDRLQGASLSVNPILAALAVGSVGGWLTAVGGAWKDAPVEGFEPLKFFRSPAMTMAFALLLAPFTERWLYLAMAALGYERAAVETYKTFFFPNKPRGKFAGKPIVDPGMLSRRVKFAYLFGLIWVVVTAAYATAWAQPSRGVFGARGDRTSSSTAG
ncbi:MAG: hypothetical protein MNPFHGCM_03000 [Gemmatimonadaceae bacterium]|nr:hypothetical protein [Gemmatimonadaceae bacterium]